MMENVDSQSRTRSVNAVELTGRRRNYLYVYKNYLGKFSEGTERRGAVGCTGRIRPLIRFCACAGGWGKLSDILRSVRSQQDLAVFGCSERDGLQPWRSVLQPPDYPAFSAAQCAARERSPRANQGDRPAIGV